MSLSSQYSKALWFGAQEMSYNVEEFKKLGAQLEHFESWLRELQAREDRLLKDWINILFDNTLPLPQKKEFFTSVFKALGFSVLLQDWLWLVFWHKRLKLFPAILTHFRKFCLEAQGLLPVDWILAKELTPAEEFDFEQKIKKKIFEEFGKEGVLRKQINPHLLAGMKVIVNGKTYDFSLTTQLNRIKTQVILSLAV